MRLFVALEIPDALRVELERRAAAFQRGAPSARWVRPPGIHLTLSFWGEVDTGRLAEAEAGLRRAGAIHPVTRLALRGAGWFPPGGAARVLWVGLEADHDLAPLAAAVAEVGKAVGAPGAEETRPFHAHVTLARCQPPWRRDAAERFVERFGPPLGESFEARELVLFRSRLQRGGAVYEAVARAPFGGAP